MISLPARSTAGAQDLDAGAFADIHPSVPRHDLPLLRRHLAGRLHAWGALSAALRPLLPEGAANEWVYRRHPRIRLPWAEALAATGRGGHPSEGHTPNPGGPIDRPGPVPSVA